MSDLKEIIGRFKLSMEEIATEMEIHPFEVNRTHFSANDAHGAGPKTAQKLFEFSPDILITGNGPGGNAATVLEKTGVKIFIGAGGMTVKEAFEAYKNNLLKLS